MFLIQLSVLIRNLFTDLCQLPNCYCGWIRNSSFTDGGPGVLVGSHKGNIIACVLTSDMYICCSPHLLFTNVTLVSPDGFPRHHSDQPLAELFSYSARKIGLLGLNTWINTVKGTVIGLNRLIVVQ